MIALALTERELEQVIFSVAGDTADDPLLSKLKAIQKTMLERKAAAFKDASTPSFEGCKVYAVMLDAVGGVVAADYCLSASGPDDAAGGLEETLAQTNYGDWDCKVEEVTP